MEHRIEEWGAQRSRDLAALVDAALPAEDLSEDELLSCCWDDPPAGSHELGAVLGLPDGTGAVSVVWRPAPTADDADGPAPGHTFRPGAFVKLVAVHPDARRQGRGHALLAAAENWAWDHGAGELRLAGSPPFYLWPGVDVLATAMLCLAESRGYEVTGTGLNMSLATTFRAAVPAGVDRRRVMTDVDVAAVRALVRAHWPHWWAETARGIDHGCCHAAFAGDRAVGFVCHSVNRAGWLGPMGTDPAGRGAGVGTALVSAVCEDLMVADIPRTEISWAGPLRFYAKCGATVSRAFREYRVPRPG